MLMDTDSDFSPIVIKKSYQKQKDDLLKILDYDKPLICSQVCEQWKIALELVVEPIGWNAVWKISRKMCKEFDVPYPRTAIVEVQNVDFDRFFAKVIVIFAEDDSNIPKQVSDVPLLHLFPTVEQNYSIIDVYQTADILQDLRVFFNNLWYPWDEKLLGSEDWLTLHFEERLQLHYDILTGQINQEIRFIVENLIKEGKDVYERFVKLEDELLAIDSEDSGYLGQDAATKDMRYLSMCELQVQLNHISEQLIFYEKKNVRELMEKKLEKVKENNDVCQVIAAWSSGTPAEFMSFVEKMNSNLSPTHNISIQCSDSLDKLMSGWKLLSEHVRKLFLSKGNYNLSSRTLVNGSDYFIQGLDNCEDTIIRDSGEDLCLVDIGGQNFNICNATIKTSNVKYVLLVRSGVCHLKSVKFVNDDETEIGIFVLGGARLVASDCHFSNFSSAVHANKGSSVILSDCIFENNINGLEFEECDVDLNSCDFKNNKGYGMLMEPADSKLLSLKEGNDVFKELPSVQLQHSTFNGNKVDMAKYY